MQKTGKKKTGLWIVLVLVFLAAVAAAVFLVRKQTQTGRQKSSMTGIQTAAVTVGDVEHVVSADGSISDKDTEIIDVPSEVTILQMTAHIGDQVHEGSPLADIHEFSAMQALSNCQKAEEELDVKIHNAEGDVVSSIITAGVGGRVKSIYAVKGAAVVDCMADYGALAEISMDGYMAVDVPYEQATGDSFSVKHPDGSVSRAEVLSQANGILTLGISDSGPKTGEQVSVLCGDGEIGSGTLYIHRPVRIMGVEGTVNAVNCKEEEKVDAGTAMFYLTDTTYTGEYSSLLEQRAEKEKDAALLAKMLNAKAVVAPYDGTITEILWTEESTANSHDRLEVARISPDHKMNAVIQVDEYCVSDVKEGMTAAVTLDSSGLGPVEGVVTEVDRVGETVDDKMVYTVKIEFDKQPGMLSGMTADAVIHVEKAEKVLQLPNEAIQSSKDGPFVFLGVDEKTGALTDVRPVQTGIVGEEMTEIRSGLQEDDTVFWQSKGTGKIK